MKLKLLACEVLARLVYHLAAVSANTIDIELVDKGLHSEPDRLRAFLQHRLDTIEPRRYDAILLGYGLCSNALVGLTCAHTQMILPRAHDCISLFLGSRHRYAQEFSAKPGTYWYTPDYIERNGGDTHSIALGTSSEEYNMTGVYEEYVLKYGQDNADYLMEVMGAWTEHYDRAAYIDTPEVKLPDYSEDIQRLAERRGWTMERLAGSLVLLRNLLEGHWGDGDYLVIHPGQTANPSYDSEVVQTVCVAE